MECGGTGISYAGLGTKQYACTRSREPNMAREARLQSIAPRYFDNVFASEDVCKGLIFLKSVDRESRENLTNVFFKSPIEETQRIGAR